MKRKFNNNANIHLFQKFEKFSEIEKDINFFESNSKRIFDSIEGPKKAYSQLKRNKYKEFFEGTPKKISREEKELIDQEYLSLLNFKNAVQDKVDLAELAIKKSMEKRNVDYTLPIVKNKKLKRASKRFFGETKTSVSFEDYQKALKRKKELERAESSVLMEPSED